MITEVDLSGTPCFTPGTKLRELKQINFIFGPNGTGKTSITRILSGGPDDKRITRETEPTNREILILNADYIRNTFQSTEDGIFFLGEENIAAEKQIEENRLERDELNTQLSELKERAEAIKKEEETAYIELIDEIWDLKRKIPENLESCITGFKKDKKKLESKAKEIRKRQFTPKTNRPKDLSELAAEEKGLLTSKLQLVSSIKDAPLLTQDLREVPSLLTTPLIPATNSQLSALIDQLNNSDWVRQGKQTMDTHLDTLEDRCPFCQQQLPSNFEAELNKLWDSTYTDSVMELDLLHTALTSSIEQLSNFKSAINDHALEEVKKYAECEAITVIENALSEALKLLTNKLEKHSQRFELSCDWNIDTFNTSLQTIYNHLNELIEDHNLKANNQSTLKDDFKEEFWQIFSHITCDPCFIRYEKTIEGKEGTRKRAADLKDEIQSTTDQLNRVKGIIRAAERRRMDIQPAIEEINSALSGIGITSFELGAATHNDSSKDQHGDKRLEAYTLLRSNPDGTKVRADVNTLSDGERNLICFLYFFYHFHQSTIDTNTKFTVVIDDPINAMDGLSSFITSGFIRELIRSVLMLKKTPKHKYVDQLIVLTHSTRFHIETSYELPTDGKKAKQCAFYVIQRTQTTSASCGMTKSIIGNPTHTTTIANEYSLLWTQIRNAHNSLTDTTVTNHTQTLFIGNAMRRIIEAYFIHLGNCASISELGRSPDPATRALMAFCNNNSHDALDMDLHTICSIPLDQLFTAFRGIFASNHAEDHYCMMMREGIPIDAGA